MMNRLANFIPVLLAGMLIAGCSPNKQDQKNGSTQQGDELPHDPYSAQLHPAAKKSTLTDFETELVSGESFRLSEQKGKVVLLNIWATWCPPCEEETPDLVELYEQYRDHDVLFLGISIDEQGKSVVLPFIEKHNVTYPMTIDDGTIMDKYGPLMGVPTTYIVDRDGNLRYFATGAVTKKEIAPRLEKLINEKSR